MSANPDNQKLNDILDLFFDEPPAVFEIKSTSRGDNDFREAIIVKCESGDKYVIKIAGNDFTFPEKIETWKRCTEEYRRLSYYCPEIFTSKSGDYPCVEYKGHSCFTYMEEYSRLRSADSFDQNTISFPHIMEDAFIMTAKVAAQKYDFCDFPSGYCLFDRFCPSDLTDEVTENANEWKRYAETLPAQFERKVRRIYDRWIQNREELKKIYPQLPTSVFQGDLNPTNLLLDDEGSFAGVLDFNLCGKDVFLNYLFREIYSGSNDHVLDKICATLKIVSQYYSFSDIEKEAAPLLYRCIKPLWFTQTEALKEAGDNLGSINNCLNETEYMQTRDIDFSINMIY